MKRNNEDGQAMVETALCFVILMVMLMGVIQGGLLFYAHHYVAYAARKGSRWAIVRGSQCTGGMSYCPVTSDNDITQYVSGLGGIAIDTKQLTVTVNRCPTASTGVLPAICTSGSDYTQTTGNNQPGDEIVVTVTYDVTPDIPFIPANTFHLKSSSQMIMSQ